MRRGESGSALVESLVAVAILGTALVLYLGGISTGALTTARTENTSTAQQLARSQMEYVKSAPYETTGTPYPTITPEAGYEIEASSAPVPGGNASVQLITVEVSRDGVPVFTLQGLRVDR